MSYTLINLLNKHLLIQDLEVVSHTEWNPNYLIVILSGVLLALAFQLILTALSIAIGITSIGDLKQNYIKNKWNTGNSNKNEVYEEYTYDQNASSQIGAGVKITSAFGIWSVLTTCISLFVATAIVVRMSLISINGTNIATGLVIWALFFIILFYLEVRVANTVIGGLVNTALSGLRGASEMVRNTFSPSEASKLNAVIEKSIATIRDEFSEVIDPSKLHETINRFFETADRKLPDYQELIDDLENIASKSSTKSNPGKWIALQQVVTKLIDKNSSGNNPGSKRKTERLKSFLSTIQTKFGEGNTTYESLANVVEGVTSIDKDQIDKKYKEIQNYFSTSSDEGFDTKRLKDFFTKIYKDPSMLQTIAQNNLKELNRTSIINFLDANTSIDRSKINTYVHRIENQLNQLRQSYYDKYEKGIIKEFEERIEDFLNTTNRSEIHYDALREDFKKIIDNPKESVKVLQNRFSKMNGDTIKALITNNKYVTIENIDDIIYNFEHAKNQVSDRYQSIQDEISRRSENVKRQVVINSEKARRTAASAAWWLFITAVFSAGAAIAGSAVSI